MWGAARGTDARADAACTMHRPEEAFPVPIEQLSPGAADRPAAEPAYSPTVVPIPPRVVRCACQQCGAHTNALRMFRASASCPTCGSFRLVPLDGAQLMDETRLVA